jgi:hypothetical protein
MRSGRAYNCNGARKTCTFAPNANGSVTANVQ